MLIKIIYILTTLTVTNPQTQVYQVTTDTITSTVPAAYYEANADLYQLPEMEVIRIDTIR